MDWIGMIVQLVSGAVGGTVVGRTNMGKAIDPVLKLVVGAIGGIGGGQLAGMVVGGGAAVADGAAPGFDFASLITNVLAGGVGGGVLTGILGMLKGGSKE
ncbi:hypothetical protein [Frigidibacter sp. ROC022]|uniref:hypothetical protein n=1 Tax=Frigidibacter sp. ROC022 TaxID=2971796 RepID=UPI00215AA26E|nr:hypothetical protein [Frigidibacter sp. ROC022]MCR8724875.1 hypothetical protein [Frigidibacter sp. ROC022]